MKGRKTGQDGCSSEELRETGVKEEVTDMLPALLLPMVAIVGAFAVVIVSMILKSKAKDREHRERMFLAEKGVEIPAALYDVREAPRPAANNGFRAGRAWLMFLGTVMVFIGIGAMVALTVRHGIYEGIHGLIPLLIGVGFLAAERMITRFVAKPN
jgi:hypothetical protein